MEPTAQIVYYLDNANISIVEIENDVVGLKDIYGSSTIRVERLLIFLSFVTPVR
jgi:hypothetical protein